MRARILHGDCRQVLATLPDASVDAIVTDPPYGINFMGKAWDGKAITEAAATGVDHTKTRERSASMHAGSYDLSLKGNRAFEVWFHSVAVELFRVLKPGGHLLAFGGTRTYHRMTVAIEDAGFEVRDSIHWLYGSGFPKSLDVSKAIDKQRDDLADIYKVTAWVRAARDAAGITNRDIDAAFGTNGMAGHWTSSKSQPAIPTLDQVPKLLDVLGVAADEVPDDIRRLLWDLNGRKGQPGENWAKREVVGSRGVNGERGTAGGYASGIASLRDMDIAVRREIDITAPATDAARQWQGWGTALKPAHEPIVVARKPLSGTVAGNVLEHGTGALNIDGCRVATTDNLGRNNNGTATWGTYGNGANRAACEEVSGRWPANLVLTHAADCDDVCADGCPVAELDGQSGNVKSGIAVTRNGGGRKIFGQPSSGAPVPDSGYTDSGGASRFFTVTDWDPIADAVPFRYVAKPNRRERNADGTVDNRHPTVKPVALMRWLVRLVTPPGGIVLDPFTGSGTTGVAAVLEGFDFVGCEMTDDYLPIIEGRLAWAAEQTNDTCDTTSGTSPEKGSHKNQPEHASQVSPDDHPNLFGDAA